MIDEYWTWVFYGYHSDELSPRSGKQIVAVCDRCCKYRSVKKDSYRDLCSSCVKIGRHVSEEWRRNISESMSGSKNHNYGKTFSEEHRRKLYEAAKGKVITEKTRRKISEATSGKKNHFYGKHHTVTTRDKISEATKGDKHHFSGKHFTKEHRQRLSASNQGISYEKWNGFVDNSRSHVTPSEKCIKINDWFKGSHAHHITPMIVVYIPSELHTHISHNIQTGKNMGEVNVLAIQFVNGGL